MASIIDQFNLPCANGVAGFALYRPIDSQGSQNGEAYAEYHDHCRKDQ